MVKVMEPEAGGAPFLADQRALRAASSHFFLISASALPVAEALVTTPSSFMVILTVTTVRRRNVTCGLGQLRKERPFTLPDIPLPSPPDPDTPPFEDLLPLR